MSWGNDGGRPSAREGVEQTKLKRRTDSKLAALGYDQGSAKVLAAAERAIRDGGIGIDIDVTGLSRLWTSVDFYLDLGVLQGDMRRKRLSPGRKNLLPDSKLASVQTRIRNNLYDRSFVVGLLGNHRYVPDGAFLEWKERHDGLVQEFYEVRDDYIARYDELVAALVEDYRNMAKETWEALESRGDAGEQRFTQEYTLESFQAAVVAKAMEHLPSPDEMRAEIHVRISVATWMLPVEAAQDALERERILALEQKEREEREYWHREERARSEAMEKKWEATVEEAMVRKKRAKAEQAAVEAAHQAHLSLIETEKEAKVAAIKAAQIELARQSVAEMANPLDEMLNGLRDRMYQSTKDILANIGKHGRVVGKQVTAIENMVALFKMLNAAGDHELEAKINQLAASLEVQGMTTKRSTGAIMDALHGVAGVALTKAETLVDLTAYDEFDALDL